MATLSDIQTQAWQAVFHAPVNPDAAFYKEWLARKAGFAGPVGVPVSEDTQLDDGSFAQAFSSGVVLHWTGQGVEAV